jgi:hypothetical protein
VKHIHLEDLIIENLDSYLAADGVDLPDRIDQFVPPETALNVADKMGTSAQRHSSAEVPPSVMQPPNGRFCE